MLSEENAMKHLSLRALYLFGLVSYLVACGPKVITTEDLKSGTPRSVALLPLNYPSGIQRERVDYLRSSLTSELKNSGFIVIDENIVMKTCSTPACPEEKVLSEKYFVDGFFTLELTSITRNSFIAGYYNAISGKLALANKNHKSLIEVEHTESERGGLLFNSGQIIQGVISQIKNSNKDSYGSLADRFAQTLVSKVPSPLHATREDEGSSVSIQRITITKNKFSADEICAMATPASMAFLVLPGQHANLREAAPGKYCGIFRPEDLPSDRSKVKIEVRSPYGSSARQSLGSDSNNDCNLKGLVRVQSQGISKQLVIACTRRSNSGKFLDENCGEHIQSCPEHRFLVYSAVSPIGPFTKVAELRNSAWQIPAAARKSEAVYQVVAVDKHGDFSVPESATFTAEAKSWESYCA